MIMVIESVSAMIRRNQFTNNSQVMSVNFLFLYKDEDGIGKDLHKRA